MTNSEYKLMEHLEQAFDALAAAKNIAHSDKHPEATIISNLLDALENITSETWGRFRAETK
jgi:hypothetical protein